jgi:multiple sugar transport system ATP-binding protein
MASVTLSNLRKVYENGFVAVHDVTLEVADGEFLVLVGPSGCGKSTTLRMIAGLESITGGELRIGDRVVNHVPPAERDIAMVFQNYALYPHMSVYENMAFALTLRRVSRPEVERRVREAAGILDIEEILDHKPRQLSGGQRQRVAVGRAIVRQPQVFLFDEPLSNLDAKLRVQTRKEISRLHRRLGATMIYVTHDQVEAMTMGDRIVVQDRGLVQQVGAPLELYHRPINRFVAGFIGSPAMNFLQGVLGREADTLVFRTPGGISLPLPDTLGAMAGAGTRDGVVLGIRPESLYLAGGPGDPPQTSASLTVFVDVVEPMGRDVFLYGRAGADELVARLETRHVPAPGETLTLLADLGSAHLFHARTGERIGPETG